MTAFMGKSHLYVKMLSLSLAYIRNIQSQSEEIKGKDVSCCLEAELVHNLTTSLLSPDFSEHDIWFLNHQAKYLLKRIFPAYVEAFGAYRAALHDWSVTRSDWPAVVAACDATKKDVNGREGVFRINAANYFDEKLCLRAFGKSPQQIINCLKGHVEETSELAGGVLIVVSYTPPTTSEIATAGERLKELLVG